MNATVATYSEGVVALLRAMDEHDPGCVRHCLAVGRYADVTARRLGLSGEGAARVRLAGVVHDVGKLAVPEDVLHEPGPLDDDGWREVRRHPAEGARILHEAGFDEVAEWVLSHHERLDGDGYPRRLQQGKIPIEARILAVVDAYEAMTADRVYRPALGHVAARAELERCAGTQFDPEVVAAFTQAIEPVYAAASQAPEPES